MKIEITDKDKDILADALNLYIYTVRAARDQMISAGAVIEHDPCLDINRLHKKIITAKEDQS